MSSATLAFDILTRYKDKGADKAARDLDRVGKSSSRMSGNLKKAAAVGAAAFGAGMFVAAKSLVGMTKAAIEDDAAQKRLALALKNNAHATKGQVAATEAWITKQGKALGISDDQLRPALGRLVTATHDVGKAQRLASLAMDVSAGTGKSLKQVTEAIMKAQNGQVSGLGRLGIKVKDAQGKTVSFTEATRRMSEQFGGQAQKNAGTLEGKMRRLSVQWDEAKEAIGARLIPVVTKLVDKFVQDGIPAIQKTVEVGKNLTAFVKDHQTQAKILVGTIAALVVVTKLHTAVMAVQAAGGIVPMLKGLKLVSAATKTYAAVQWVLNAALTANPIGLVVVALAALAVGVVVAYKKSETFRNIVQGAWKVIGTAARLYWNLYLKPVFTVLKLGFAAGAAAARGMRDGIGRAWEGIKTKAQSSVRWVVDKILWMAEKILDAAEAAFGWAPGIGDNLKRARDKVAGFRDGVNRELGKIKDEAVTVRVHGITTSIGGLKLGAPSAVTGHAKGGPIKGGTPGRDSVLAALMPNEHVLTTEEVRKAGGHSGVYAIRRMLREGKFRKLGDVPHFAQGGPVVAARTPDPHFVSPLQGFVTRNALSLAAQVAAKVRAILKSLGGAGSLTPAQISRGQRFARSQVGDPYVWGGVGPNGFDCSGFVGAVLNAALGQNPYRRRGSTGTMPWAGFKPGPGSFSAGWFTGSPGHMAGSIGGMGIESAGGVGVRVGGAARSVRSFPHIAHYDRGGMLQPGWTMAYNGTGRPEPVGHDLSPTFKFTNCTFVGGSQKSFEDMLTKAWDNLQRKGRLSHAA